MLFWIWMFVLAALLWLKFWNMHLVLKKRGVNHLPTVTFFGNLAKILVRGNHMCIEIAKVYQAFPEDRFVGNYDLHIPTIVLKDIELIKQVTIKDFSHFVDHSTIVATEADPVFGRAIFALKGDDWKTKRNILSTKYTTSKLNLLMTCLEKSGDHLLDSLRGKIRTSKGDYVDVEAKELFNRCNNDVNSAFVFSFNVNTHADENIDIYQYTILGGALSFLGCLKFLTVAMFPKLTKVLKTNFVDPKTYHFFLTLIKQIIKDRTEKNEVRKDLLQMLMEPKKVIKANEDNSISEENEVLSLEEVAVEAIILFIGSNEGVSTTVSFLLYEMAVNPDMQETLVQEIREADRTNEGRVDITAIQEMKYLDMVVSETLRKWPPFTITDRICTKNYNLGKPNKHATEDYIINEGERVVLPLWAIHRDPANFPDPEKFDPERFSPENKHKTKAFMAFGLGPRKCIGMRLALLMVKFHVYTLLKSIEVSPADKTQIPAQIVPQIITIKRVGGEWIRFKERK